jgi:hypothetical protein
VAAPRGQPYGNGLFRCLDFGISSTHVRIAHCAAGRGPLSSGCALWTAARQFMFRSLDSHFLLFSFLRINDLPEAGCLLASRLLACCWLASDAELQSPQRGSFTGMHEQRSMWNVLRAERRLLDARLLGAEGGWLVPAKASCSLRSRRRGHFRVAAFRGRLRGNWLVSLINARWNCSLCSRQGATLEWLRPVDGCAAIHSFGVWILDVGRADDGSPCLLCLHLCARSTCVSTR